LFVHSLAKKIFIAGFLLLAAFAGSFIFIVHSKIIDFSVLENYNPGKPSIVLDDQGKEWARFQLDRRKFVPLHEMPESLIQAFLATEDHRFYDHCGLSIQGIVRSLFVNLYHGKKVQGASTITQQLVRLLFFDAKKTFTRKMKEQLFSLIVEFQFTKEQILETYLNHVYFNHGIYGVQAACQRFWNISVQDLQVDQAAILAGMVRSPGTYSPLVSPHLTEKRRNTVLRLMEKRGFLSHKDYLQARQQPIVVAQVEKDTIAPHVKEMVRIFLEDLVGKQQLYSGGLTIQTTLNYGMQKAAESSFSEHISMLKNNLLPTIDGALIAMSVTTGEIKALIGGYDFSTSKFNRATQAKRQMGSIFKPFVYAAAVEQGASFVDTEIDEPFELVQGHQVWTPQNTNYKFLGQCTLAKALSCSNNIIAIKTLLRAGVDAVVKIVGRVHIHADVKPYPSLALGCLDTNVYEAVGAFNIFANNGVYVQPHYIRWVKDALGVKMYKAEIVKERVMDSTVSGQVLRVLTLGMFRLKKTIGQQWFGGDAAGKTGTTNDSRTSWFCGSTPEITTAIYIGSDDNQSLGNKVYGSKTAFPIWFHFTKQITHGEKFFDYHPLLKEVFVDPLTGAYDSVQKNRELLPLLILPEKFV
jgi:penicillin-binding protein 1A